MFKNRILTILAAIMMMVLGSTSAFAVNYTADLCVGGTATASSEYSSGTYGAGDLPPS